MGNEEKAIKRICAIFDWYYNDEIMAATRKISADRSRVGAYPSKMNLPQYSKKGTTYIDTLKDDAGFSIDSIEQLEAMKAEGKISISQASFERWGLGLSDSDYKTLDEHYKTLKKQNPNCDDNQEIFVKDLCYIKLQQMESMKKGKADDFKTYTDLYRNTFKAAGLKTRNENDNLSNPDECWGVFIRDIEQYAPAEYYKNKSLFKDFDKFGEYIERFMLRPLKNLMFGSKDRDEEYSVKIKDGDE